MRKFLLGCILLLSATVYGQNEKFSPATSKDTLELLNDLLGLLDSAYKPKSYVQIGAGVSNKIFSVNNNSLNTKQTASTIVFTPSVGYFHKGGLSISATAYLLNDVRKGFGINQYALTPGYNLPDNNKFDFIASYTYYFVKDKFSSYSSPVQHDLYTSFTYKKPWLAPGLALGYSSGDSKQAFYRDTVINFIQRHFYDSITNHLKAFSVIATVGHTFEWYQVLYKKDGIIFSPVLMLNMGSSNTTFTHKTNAPNFINFLIKRGKINKLQTSPFEVQSAGLSLDMCYIIGKFTVAPQLYLDYYFPDTDEKRFTQAFSINLGYSF
ncbi:hypothetical protein LK994_14400 [Ferruginibacter lapsinanis]|uniref:hypothetical protein n=1 Tax=Ferruginibacter lapsinanis TaxID=563172 RepID=UPI001E5495CE|nr:hypothetical protein [Ferruginibacter lapsinanis]UEG49829.1 hypothetical protein LK994_14400 [Ferruginibacter lapsinanis]